MSELAARHLLAHGAVRCSSPTVPTTAIRLAQKFNGQAIDSAALRNLRSRRHRDYRHRLAHSSLNANTAKSSWRCARTSHVLYRYRVPRDVDPEMNKIDGIFVYDIDDLQLASVRTSRSQKEAEKRSDRHRRSREVPRSPADARCVRPSSACKTTRNHSPARSIAFATPWLHDHDQNRRRSPYRGIVNKIMHTHQHLKPCARPGIDHCHRTRAPLFNCTMKPRKLPRSQPRAGGQTDGSPAHRLRAHNLPSAGHHISDCCAQGTPSNWRSSRPRR